MSIAAIYFLTFMGLLMAWSNKSILAGFFLLLFPFVIFVVMGPFLDFLVKWMNRRRLKFVHRMSVEFKNSLQSSEVPEHRMLALCLKNEKEAFGYLNDEQLLFIHRWRDGDRSPEVMRAVNTFVEEQIRGIPCDIRVNRNSDLSRRLGNLYSQWLNIHKSSAIPAMEKLPVILALSALSDIMMGGENEDIVSQSMDALESRLNGIQEAIQAERHLRTVSEERKKVERGKEILKLALSEV